MQIIPDTLFLRVGDHGHLFARGFNALGQLVLGTKISWKSSEPAVAIVGDTGLVSAVAPGTSTVTTTIDAVSSSARVTVFPKQQPPTPAASFTLNGFIVGVEPGGDTTRTVRVSNADVTLYRIAPADWSPVTSGEFHNPPLKELVGTTRSGANGEFSFGTQSSAWYRAEAKAPTGSTYMDGATVISPPWQAQVTITVILHQKR